MKRTCLFSVLSMALVLSIAPVKAEEPSTDLSYEGYTEVWSDEFEGTELNREDWNVELHDKGWVNNELQAYVDSEENIFVKDGKLYLNPVKKVTKTEVSKNLFTNADFSEVLEGWTETIANWGGDDGNAEAYRTLEDGKIIYDIKNPGNADWNIQLMQKEIEFKAGHKYQVSYKVVSTAARQIKSGVMSASYEWFGGSEPALEADKETDVSFTFTMRQDTSADFYISLGLVGETPASVVTVSDLKLIDLTASNLIANADFANGKDGWTETIANWGGADGTAVASSATEDGKITYTIDEPGTQDWNVQLKKEGIELTEGHTYTASFNITSTETRAFKTGVMSTTYEWFGGVDTDIVADKDNQISFDFTMGKTTPADFYISLGRIDETTPASVVTVSDILLIDKTPVTKEVTNYTSGRVSTQNKQTFTYGMFEVSAKVPAGQGYLPAFWLMANDENIYGQWPRCGEIDCMEVMGQDTTKLYGTIHYGNPHSESQGTYVTASEPSFSDEFHKFTCEWEPGSIKWYVDGKLFHEESDWYSTTENQGTLTYPAPFDQPFYIILNLAVGGSWVGNPNDETSFDNNPYIIDYVKVMQKEDYNEDVEKPVKPVVLRDPDEEGNYIVNGKFNEEDLTDDKDWKFLTALEGEGTADIADNTMTIKTTDEGTVDYSVQLVQANLPFEKGAEYTVTFDAYASAEREMNVDVKAPDRGYMNYMETQKPKLTTEKQTYSYTFKMKADSDPNGRLEFNMGAAGSTADIYISNVKVEKTKDADPNEKEVKTVLANGNYVYNGQFQEGPYHLGYWTVSNAENAGVSVTGFSDGRRLEVVMDGDEKSGVVLSQEELAFVTGTPYAFSFDAESDVDNTIIANVGGHEFTAEVKAGEKKTFSFKLPYDAEYANSDVSFTFSTAEGKTYLDNVKLVEDALIKNGSFNDGTTGYEIYVDSSAKASYVVDSLKEDNALSVTVDKTGDADWKIQVKQNNVNLENGKTYKLTFKAKSTLDRDIRVIMQGGEALGWPVYSNDNIVRLTNEYQTFEDTFTMSAATDPAAFLSVCLGNVTEEITTQHEICIDDISLVEVVDDPTPTPTPEPTPVVKVTAAESVYNGKVQTPKLTVTVDGVATTDYKVISMPTAKDAGAYTVTVEAAGVEAATKFVIHKADQKITLTSPKKNYFSYTKTYKYKTLKKKSKSFRLAFAGNQATVRKISGSAPLSYNIYSKKVTVKKKTKKGTYKLRLNAPETKNYGGSNAITIIVKVK